MSWARLGKQTLVLFKALSATPDSTVEAWAPDMQVC